MDWWTREEQLFDELQERADRGIDEAIAAALADATRAEVASAFPAGRSPSNASTAACAYARMTRVLRALPDAAGARDLPHAGEVAGECGGGSAGEVRAAAGARRRRAASRASTERNSAEAGTGLSRVVTSVKREPHLGWKPATGKPGVVAVSIIPEHGKTGHTSPGRMTRPPLHCDWPPGHFAVAILRDRPIRRAKRACPADSSSM